MLHVIPEGEQQGKIDIRRGRKVTNKYNTRSKLNYLTISNNTPQLFKKDMTYTSTTHIGSYYIDHTNSKKYTITVEPVSYHIICETTEKS